MKQRGVTKKAMKFVIDSYSLLLDKHRIPQKEAFDYKANTIEGIPMSGKTLRKMFNGHHVHANRYRDSIERFGKDWILTDSKIDIADDQEEPKL